MSIWPPGQQNNDFLLLECPFCENRLRFTAFCRKQAVLWQCQSCGNQLFFNLIAANPSLLSGLTMEDINALINKSSPHFDAGRIH